MLELSKWNYSRRIVLVRIVQKEKSSNLGFFFWNNSALIWALSGRRLNFQVHSGVHWRRIEEHVLYVIYSGKLSNIAKIRKNYSGSQITQNSKIGIGKLVHMIRTTRIWYLKPENMSFYMSFLTPLIFRYVEISVNILNRSFNGIRRKELKEPLFF